MRALKKTSVIMLIVAMVITMIPVLPGNQSHAAVGNSNLYIIDTVGGENKTVSDSKTDNTNGWTWDKETSTLTLDGFNGEYIESSGDLKILLKGENRITPAAKNNHAIYTEGLCTIDKTTDDVTDKLIIQNDNLGVSKYMCIETNVSEEIQVILNGGTLDINVKTDSEEYGTLVGSNALKIDNNANLKMNLEAKSNAEGTYTRFHGYGNANADITVKSTSGIATGVHYAYINSGGNLNIRAIAPEPKNAMAIGFNDGSATSLKGNGKITAEGAVGMYNYGTMFNHFSIDEKVKVTPAGGKTFHKFAGDSSYYALMYNEKGELLTNLTFEATEELQPLTFINPFNIEIPGGKVGDTIPKITPNGGVFGCRLSHSDFEIVKGSLPKGLTFSSYGGYINGTFEEPCKAGTVTIEVTADGRKAQIDLKYGEVKDKPRYLTIDGVKTELRENNSGKGWSYNGANRTLVLNNFKGKYIDCEKELNIVLKGENILTPDNTKDICINVNGNLTINKTDSDKNDKLTIEGTVNNAGDYFGVYSDKTYLNGGTLNVNLQSVQTEYNNLYGINNINACNTSNLNINLKGIKAVEGVRQELCILDKSNVNVQVESTGYTSVGCEDVVFHTSGLSTFKAVAPGKTNAVAFTIDFGSNGILLENGGKIIAEGLVGRTSPFREKIAFPIYGNVKTLPEGPKAIRYNIPDTDELYSFICDENGELITNLTFIGTDQLQALTFINPFNIEIPGGKVGDSVSVFAGLGVFGCARNPGRYSIAEGTLPEGLTLDEYTGEISGSFSAPCEAGQVTIEVRDITDKDIDRAARCTFNYGDVFLVNNPVEGVSLNKTETSIEENGTEKLIATVLPENADVKEVKWSSENNDIVRVERDGTIYGKNIGETVIHAITAEGRKEATCKVKVIEKTPTGTIGIDSLLGLQPDTEFMIDGETITSDYSGAIEIKEDWKGRNIEIIKLNSNPAYSSNPSTIYFGKVENIETIKEQFALYSYEHSFIGEAITPRVFFKGFCANDDFKVEYADNLHTGTGKVIITGQNNFAGTITLNFKIKQSEYMKYEITNYEGTYDGKEHAMEVKAPEGSVVTYSDKLNGEYTEEIPEAKNVGTYTFFIKISNPDYKEVKGVGSINISPAKLTEDNFSLSSYFTKLTVKGETIYKGRANGKQILATPIIKDDYGNVLVKDKDYVLAYDKDERVNPGTYKIAIEGIGNYENLVIKKLIITPKPVTNVKVRYCLGNSGANDAYLTWSKSPYATGYQVYSRRPSKTKTWTSLGTTKNLNFTKRNLYKGYNYEFKVIPYYTSGIMYRTTGYYKTVSLKTLMTPRMPVVTKYSKGKVKVSWNNIAGESGYQISRATSKTGTYIVSTIPTTTGKYKILTSPKGTRYFKVRAYKNVVVNGKTQRAYTDWSTVRMHKLV